MRDRQKPDFLCIGPHKTGTTWLHSKLTWHPQIWLPPLKELWILNLLDESYLQQMKNLITSVGMHADMRKYFRADRQRLLRGRSLLQLKTYSRLAWWAKYLLLPYSLETYPYLFPRNQRLMAGDITPNYYFLKESVVRRLAEKNPNLKIIIILRDPVERAWSYVKMDLRDRYDTTAKEVSEDLLIEHFNRVHSYWQPYYEVIALWERHFKNVFVAYFDQLKEDPEAFHGQICRFLSVGDETYAKNFEQKINVGSPARPSEAMQQYLSRQYLEEIRALVKARPHAYSSRWLARMEQQASYSSQ